MTTKLDSLLGVEERVLKAWPKHGTVTRRQFRDAMRQLAEDAVRACAAAGVNKSVQGHASVAEAEAFAHGYKMALDDKNAAILGLLEDGKLP